MIDKAGRVLSHFPAGAADLDGIDATDERGALIFTESQPGRPCAPDALRWIGDDLIVTANAGDMDGGARSHVMIHEDREAPAACPTITSAGREELIGRAALSGLAADPKGRDTLVACDPEGESRGAVCYPLDPKGEGWMGLPEITARGDWA